MVWTADAFLKKRYQAGWDDCEAQKEAQIRRFLGEHPEATAADVREFLNQSRRNRRDGKAE